MASSSIILSAVMRVTITVPSFFWAAVPPNITVYSSAVQTLLIQEIGDDAPEWEAKKSTGQEVKKKI